VVGSAEIAKEQKLRATIATIGSGTVATSQPQPQNSHNYGYFENCHSFAIHSHRR